MGERVVVSVGYMYGSGSSSSSSMVNIVKIVRSVVLCYAVVSCVVTSCGLGVECGICGLKISKEHGGKG